MSQQCSVLGEGPSSIDSGRSSCFPVLCLVLGQGEHEVVGFRDLEPLTPLLNLRGPVRFRMYSCSAVTKLVVPTDCCTWLYTSA
jgi:hypothetical protein